MEAQFKGRGVLGEAEKLGGPQLMRSSGAGVSLYTGEQHSAYVFYLIKNCFYFMHTSVCLHVCMFTMCKSGALGDQKRALDPLKLELQTVVSCCVGAGN